MARAHEKPCMPQGFSATPLAPGGLAPPRAADDRLIAILTRQPQAACAACRPPPVALAPARSRSRPSAPNDSLSPCWPSGRRSANLRRLIHHPANSTVRRDSSRCQRRGQSGDSALAIPNSIAFRGFLQSLSVTINRADLAHRASPRRLVLRCCRARPHHLLPRAGGTAELASSPGRVAGRRAPQAAPAPLPIGRC
jgi:hypothetical protein